MARVPRTRNWKALEIPDLTGRIYRLVVTGDVEVTSTNLTPKLSAGRQGINPRILILDLRIVRTGGIGLPVLIYKHVMFMRRVSSGQYNEVDIRYRGRIIQRIRVRRVLSIRGLVARKRKKKAAKRKKRL